MDNRNLNEVYRGLWSSMSSYGGFVGAGIALWVYFRTRQLAFFPYADALIYGLMPGWILGRIGCYLTHDHPGRLTDSFFGVKYPGGARFDGGLNDILVTLGALAVAYRLGRKNDPNNPPAGTIYGAVLVLYAIPRFFLDFLRATDIARADPRYFDLTPSQYASIAIAGLGLWVLAGVHRKAPFNSRC